MCVSNSELMRTMSNLWNSQGWVRRLTPAPLTHTTRLSSLKSTVDAAHRPWGSKQKWVWDGWMQQMLLVPILSWSAVAGHAKPVSATGSLERTVHGCCVYVDTTSSTTLFIISCKSPPIMNGHVVPKHPIQNDSFMRLCQLTHWVELRCRTQHA